MKLYFERSNGEIKFLKDVKNEAEASHVIADFLKKMNYTSYYTRSTQFEDRIEYDVGSWSEKFILEL